MACSSHGDVFFIFTKKKFTAFTDTHDIGWSPIEGPNVQFILLFSPHHILVLALPNLATEAASNIACPLLLTGCSLGLKKIKSCQKKLED